MHTVDVSTNRASGILYLSYSDTLYSLTSPVKSFLHVQFFSSSANLGTMEQNGFLHFLSWCLLGTIESIRPWQLGFLPVIYGFHFLIFSTENTRKIKIGYMYKTSKHKMSNDKMSIVKPLKVTKCQNTKHWKWQNVKSDKMSKVTNMYKNNVTLYKFFTCCTQSSARCTQPSARCMHYHIFA